MSPVDGKKSATEFEHSAKPNYYLYFSVLIINISAFIAGIGIVWPSSATPRLRGTIDPEDNPLSTPLTPFEESLIGSLTPLMACVGPVIFGMFADKVGRKRTMILIMVPMLLAFIIKTVANSVTLFAIARLLLGTGSGGVFGVISIYVGELAEDRNRGALGCFLPIFCSIGILFGYAISAYVSLRLFSFIPIVPAILYFPLVWFFVPESPHYLTMIDREDLAFVSLKRLRAYSKQIVNDELKSMRAFVQESFANKLKFKDMLGAKGLRKAFVINVFLMVAQQGVGITAILTYLMTIFESSGTTISPDISTIAVGVIQLVASLITPLVIDKLGRRILLLLSSAFCAFTLSVLSLYLSLRAQGYETGDYSWIPVVTIISYMFAFCSGLGPLPWVILGEMFPQNVKALASMVVTVTSSFLAFLFAFTYPHITTHFGIAQSFWIFTFFALGGGIFVYFFLPETKGKSLHAIQLMLNR